MMTNTNLPILLALLLASGFAAAQTGAPAPEPFINRNPVFRDSLPPGPVPPPDPRDTVVPAAGPADPRDSTTRPVMPAASTDGRSVAVPGTAAQAPLPGAAASAPPLVNRP